MSKLMACLDSKIRVLACAVATFTAFFALAADRYVSTDGTWGDNDNKYSSVEDAIAAASAGDVIWLQDGFVCEPADEKDYVDFGGSTKAHIKLTKAVTIRSESGDARNNPNPPCFRGRWHDPDSDPVVKQGLNAIRALWVTSAATFEGVVFENSSAYANNSYSGGCLVGSGNAVFKKCIVRNNVSTRGAASSKTFTFYDCNFLNNVGTAVADACVYGSHFENNTEGAVCVYYNRAETNPLVISNCTFVANTNTTCSGGAVSGAQNSYNSYFLISDSTFKDNWAYQGGGAIYGWATISNCTFTGNATHHNSTSGQGGAVNCKDPVNYPINMYDCIVRGNTTYTDGANRARGGGVYQVNAWRTEISCNSAVGFGGGAYDSNLYDCIVTNNSTRNISSTEGGRGGGVYGGSATRCLIAGNIATDIVNTANAGLGGGACDANLYNCVVTNNVSKSAYGYHGGAVAFTTSGHEIVNTLIADNLAPNGGTAGVDSYYKDATQNLNTMINCTVVNNVGKSGLKGCSGNLTILNSIVWGNTGTTPTYYAASYSCLEGLSASVDETTYPGCIATDPQFAGSGDTPYALKDTHSPCVDAALTQQWMLEETDPCSKALNGLDRIIGTKPDMGAYELYQEGTVMHTVTFDLGEHGTRSGGGDLIQLIEHKKAATAPTVEAAVLWKFEGWDKEFTSVTADMTVNAVYSAVDPETVHHTVTFVLGNHLSRTGGGELVQDVVHYHAAVAPVVEADEGWTFAGWDTEFASVESDLTVNAIKKRVEVKPPEGPAYDDPDVDISQYSALTNHFVSTSGEWGGNDQKYTDLKSAMTAAKAGDVIWLRNGFVERPADASDYVTHGKTGSTRSHFFFSKQVTVRSVKGEARNHPNPPRIRGRWEDPDAEEIVKAGPNAIRALWVDGAATFEGVVFEESSTLQSAGYAGSCLAGEGVATFKKCIIRNNDAGDASGYGAISSKTFTFYDCVISNNVGAGIADCCVYNCHFENNAGGAVVDYYGRTEPLIISNCTFVANTNTKYGGAVFGPSGNDYNCYMKIYDSYFTNNVSEQSGGAVYGWAMITNCVFVDNGTVHKSTSGQGGAVRAKDSVKSPVDMYDCVVRGNTTTGSGQAHGGGLYQVNAWRTLIEDNEAQGLGGGACDCNLYDCIVRGNCATNNSSANGGLGGGIYGGTAMRCVISGNRVTRLHSACGMGAGAAEANLYNCIVSNNVSCSGYWYLGGGVHFKTAGHEVYNTLVVGNTDADKGAVGITSDKVGNIIYNSTIAGNVSTKGGCSVRGVTLVNSIVGTNPGAAVAQVAAMTNSCVEAAFGEIDPAVYPGCVAADPRFTGKGATPYALSLLSPCRDTALVFDWMTNPDDVRSKDLGGNARIIGAGPDMGAYERNPSGLMLLVK